MFGRTKAHKDQPPDTEVPGAQGSEDQERVILAALDDLRDMTVREIMTPRVDVVGLPIPVHASDVARAVRESGHSCFPVFDDDLDHLVGILFVNDLFRAGWDLEKNGRDSSAPRGSGDGALLQDAESDRSSSAKPTPLDISRRLREPFLIPESRMVLDVLADMRRKKHAVGVVVDEYGGVAGILTTKDILAALVGDLRDEFDPGGEPDIIRVDRSRWLIDGGTSIDDVTERLGIGVPEGEYVTMGGFVFDVLGHIPDEGERFVHYGWEFKVAEMDRRRVAKIVAVQKHDESEPEETDKN